ncbi:phage tail tape measure protein [Curtobacterium citreum]|uniref:phage tail tape measure protein n=1 Tax=Curtobacterium citreum TaxID=2036 RepID=UPI000735E7D6|nr:phage tail tape measure protein [Curtobacterium citreum]KTR11066.1 hypothetical protein NS330_12955 [Curtobacterium citreum]
MGLGSDRSVILEVGAKISGFVNAMNQGSQAANQFSQNVQRGAVAAARALHDQREAAESVAKPLLAIGTIAALGVGYAVKSYADFDERMSSVKSLSHATADEMELLKTAALTTGTAIGFSATQAADAEIELVKAGTSAADIYGGALAGSLKLAAAGQIDVADATEIAASTMAQFGLQGKDVTHIADLLSAGADKALGGVSELGEGLKYIGPVAAAAHVGLEQTVGSLALLAQNGIMGEQAGTSLRGMLLSLTAPSEVARKAMEQYGIQVYDAEGKFVGFNGVAEELKTKLGTLDDAQRDAALGTIFGNAQITAATVLMKGGAKEVDNWTKAVNEQGFATEQAVGKMDNLNGDLTRLKASFQTAAIVTGEAADGPLRAAVQVVTDMIETYNRAPGAVQAVTLGVGALTAAVALGGGTMLIAIPKVVAFGVALQTLSTAGIPGVSRAAGAGLKAANGLGRALSATGALLLGPVGIALGAGAVAITALSVAAGSGAKSQEELTNAIATSATAVELLNKAGERSGVSKFLAGDIGKNLQDLPTVLKDLGTEGYTAGTVLRVVGDDFASLVNSKKKYIALGTLREEAKSIENLGAALAQVASADAPAAAKAFSDVVKQQKLSRDETLQLIHTMKPYEAALLNQASALGIHASATGTASEKSNLLKLAMGDYEGAAAAATNPTKENSDALKKLDTSAEDAAKAVEATSKALRDLTSPTLDAREAQRQFEAAVDAVTSSIQENGTSLDVTTDKGRSNQAALDGIAQSAQAAAGALYTQTGSQETATAAMQAGRDELIRALGQYGITGQAAEDYANTIIGTPTDWATTFSNNAPQTTSQVNALRDGVIGIPSGKTITMVAETAAAQNQLDAFIMRNNGRQITVRQVLVQQAIDAGAAPGAAKAAYATGGEIRGPGTGTSDQVPIWASNREWIIRERSASMYGHTIMSAINEGRLSKTQLLAAMSHSGAPAYAAGGPIAPVRYAEPSATVIVQAPAGGAARSFSLRVDNHGQDLSPARLVRTFKQAEALIAGGR